MTDNLMTESERKFDADIKRIFGEIENRVLPDTAVESVRSHDWCEDGKTFAIMCDMVDGSLAMISVCPGAPITARVVT